MDTNAREEFLQHTKDKPEILCAWLEIDTGSSKKKEFKLKKGYSKNDFVNFIDKLNFEYYSGYGCQYLYGVIWFQDGSWSDRDEYDGSEWWAYRSCPSINEYL